MPISKKVYRHRISLQLTTQKIEMPVGSQVLNADYDGTHVNMCVLSDTYMKASDNPPLEVREFFIIATGTEFEIDEGDTLIPIGTIPVIDSEIHLFELKTIQP